MPTEKPPLLFIHGMWAQPRVWRHFEAYFRDRGHEVLSPMLPYHDGPPGGPAPAELGRVTLQEYVDALEEAAKSFARPPVIIGHSMGGLLAQLLAARLKPPGLALLSPAPSAGIWTLKWPVLRSMASVLFTWGHWRRPVMISEKGAMYGLYNGVPDAEAHAEYAALVPESGRALAQIAYPWRGRRKGAKVDYQAFDCPTLIVVGRNDRFTPPSVARATARRLQGPVSFRELKGDGHWIIGAVAGSWSIRFVEEFLEALRGEHPIY